jgi:hypothetical protein
VIDVGEAAVKLLTNTPPKKTAWTPPKFVPLIVTLVPPPVGPEDVDRPVTVARLASAE